METPTQSGNQLLTTAQLSAELGIARQTLNNWRCTGRFGLPFIRVGRAVRYRRADVEAFLRARTESIEVAA